ncbi:hypothetical protein MXL46_13985 [Heyndrickxia sporothermodurans]|uniref:hypothetical protein n=1 Tax=Heyndrickxia sporothermodurans TaxID=46224 RepID=UPI002DBE9D22|nr:hypothetical protein [Heyndrickxia sporothermodurans]MEB6550201.1 hypothetical protein [Heyndrickxia sporothermodurans]
MSQQIDQIKDEYLEAMMELFEKFFKTLKKDFETFINDAKEGYKLSENAKMVGEKLKEEPELAKKLMKQYAAEKINPTFEKLKDVNAKVVDGIKEMKRDVDVSTVEGKEQYAKLDKIEKIQTDKFNTIAEKVKALGNNNTKELNSNNHIDNIEKLEKGKDDNKVKEVNTYIVDSKSEVIHNKKNEETNNVLDYKTLKKDSVSFENEYVDSGVTNDNKVDWKLEHKEVIKTEEIDIDKIPTSEKLKQLENSGVNISRLHSRTSINIEYIKLLESEGKEVQGSIKEEKREDSKIVLNDNNTERKTESKVDIEIER